MKRILIIFLLPAYIVTYSQNLDSLFNKLMEVRGMISQSILPQSVKSSKPEKCGFGLFNAIKFNFSKFSLKQKAKITDIMQRPSMDTSFVTPSGKFRIHYNKTGINAPGYDLIEFANAADSAYNYEVNVLGYPPPPADNGEGGDDKYDIYIQHQYGQYYGNTTPDQQISTKDSTWTSYISLDNAFSVNDSYKTNGIDAAKVTIAHEFHHAIQIGNYIDRYDKDSFYYELTSTSMEQFVYKSIKDYLNSLNEYFSNPSASFSSNSGYDLAIWNLFLASQFDNPGVPDSLRGKNIIRRTWRLMPKERALQTIAQAIDEAGSSFGKELNTFGQWTYFTGSRAENGKYFDDAAQFPLIKPLMGLTFQNPPISLTVTTNAVSNNFLYFADKNNPTDTFLVAIISNSDIAGGIPSVPNQTSFDYKVSNQSFSGSQEIGSGYYFQMQTPNPSIFSTSYIFNGNPTVITTGSIDYVYPQPFKYSQNRILNFPASGETGSFGDVYIYDIGMQLVYSSQARVTDKRVIQWNGICSNGKKLGTGVYIYVTKCGDNIQKGKFVIYND